MSVIFYGTSDTGARHPLPLSLLPLVLFTPLSSHPCFRAHFGTESSKGSRWHFALRYPWSHNKRQRNAANLMTKKPWKRGYTSFHILFGASYAHWLSVVVDYVVVVVKVLLMDGCCCLTSKQTIFKSWNFLGFRRDPGTFHMRTHFYTHRNARRRSRVLLSELCATSSAFCLGRAGNTTGSARNLDLTCSQTRTGFNLLVLSAVV